MFGDVTKFGLGKAQAHPNDVAAPSNWDGNRSFALLFWRSCCCKWRLLLCGILCCRYQCPNNFNSCRNALQQDGRGYTSVFTIGPCCMQHRPKWPKKLQLLGSLSLKAPPELCPWTTLAHKVPIPLAALSGNECFSLSLRLCFSNDVSWLDDWSLDDLTKILVPICLYCLK